MKLPIKTLVTLGVLLSTQIAHANQVNELELINNKKWVHGAANCKSDKSPVLDVLKVNETSYILRQNKCLTFEAPFIYVLVGEEKVLVLDTGAIDDEKDMPLVKAVNDIIAKSDNPAKKQIIIAHSHTHSDHYAGDKLFSNQENVIFVGTTQKQVNHFFKMNNWPNDISEFDLGNRKLSIIPTPGHQNQAITIYDPQTKWLLTGDSFYPGLIYIKDWQQYKKSISRLTEFSKNNKVSALLGAHIEMSNKPTQFYDIGTTYQPHEAPLNLSQKDLVKLNNKLQSTSDEEQLKFDKFIIQPMNFMQKSIVNVVSFFKG